MNMHFQIKKPTLNNSNSQTNISYELRSSTGRTVLSYDDLGRASDQAFKRNLRLFVVTNIAKEITCVPA